MITIILLDNPLILANRAISLVSRFMANPGIAHFEELKWILRYLKGSCRLGLTFIKKKGLEEVIKGFVDTDYAGSLDTRKPLTGFVFTLFGATINWKENLQSVVALPTTESE